MKNAFIIYPLLAAVLPIISLFERNKDMVQYGFLLWPIIISVSTTMLIFCLFNLFMRNRYKAALATGLFAILFFSFKNLLAAFPDINIGIITLYSSYILLFILSLFFIFLFLLIKTSEHDFVNLTKILNQVFIILVIIPLASLLFYGFKNKNIDPIDEANKNSYAAPAAETTQNEQNFPDVYYIIFDAYARADVLKQNYNYDNNQFINFLKNTGFYVADAGRANYPQTYLSLASSLNMDYIDNLSPAIDKNSGDRKLLKDLIKNNRVTKFFQKQGYKFVTFPSTWSGYYKNFYSDIDIHDALSLNEFNSILINNTPIGIIFARDFLVKRARAMINFDFKHAPDVADIKGPTFTYIHVLSPHPPFIFDENGNPIKPKINLIGYDGYNYFQGTPTQAETNIYKQKYAAQVKNLNNKAVKMIKAILDKSDIAPIIILQSDHGPGRTLHWEKPEEIDMKERLANFNAFYLPKAAAEKLYPSITPINSFRIILNYLFHTKYELLEDKSFFANWSQPYKFIDVSTQTKN